MVCPLLYYCFTVNLFKGKGFNFFAHQVTCARSAAAQVFEQNMAEREKDTRERSEKCWELDINWDLYPDYLRKVS